MRQIMLIAAFLAIGGCASMPDEVDERGEVWYYNDTPIPKTHWRVTYHSQVELAFICQNARALACVIRKEGFCFIHFPVYPRLWLIRHEERHCEGWNHEPKLPTLSK